MSILYRDGMVFDLPMLGADECLGFLEGTRAHLGKLVVIEEPRCRIIIRWGGDPGQHCTLYRCGHFCRTSRTLPASCCCDCAKVSRKCDICNAPRYYG